MRKFINVLLSSLFFLSCNTNKNCNGKSFFSEYKKKYQTKELSEPSISDELLLKERVFSKLCISNNEDKILFLDYKRATNSYYSKGLIFLYSDSSSYYYELSAGKLRCGKGINNDNALANILESVKINFNKNANEIKIRNERLHLLDASSIKLILYDKFRENKFYEIKFNLL